MFKQTVWYKRLNEHLV